MEQSSTTTFKMIKVAGESQNIVDTFLFLSSSFQDDYCSSLSVLSLIT